MSYWQRGTLPRDGDSKEREYLKPTDKVLKAHVCISSTTSPWENQEARAILGFLLVCSLHTFWWDLPGPSLPCPYKAAPRFTLPTPNPDLNACFLILHLHLGHKWEISTVSVITLRKKCCNFIRNHSRWRKILELHFKTRAWEAYEIFLAPIKFTQCS